MNRTRTLAAVVLTIGLLGLFNSAGAQSKDSSSPTPLRSNEVSGVIESAGIGSTYYYSFTANRGEISIKISVWPGRPAKYGDLNLSTVSVRVFNAKGEEVIYSGVSTGTVGKSYVAKSFVMKRQTMVLSVEFPSGGQNNALGGKYQLQLDGSVDVRPDELTTGARPLDAISIPSKGCSPEPGPTMGMLIYSKCFPKQGALIVEMKDGSKKVIDLSEAETITVVP